jgi:thioredoxin-related protein
MKKENILLIGLIALACGVIAAYIYSKQKSPTSSFADTSSEQHQLSSNIDWKKYSEGMDNAQSLNKPIVLYFWAAWCTYCKKMEKTTLAENAVLTELKENFISISVDMDKDKKLVSQWNIRGVPAIWFLKSDGTKISNIPGYVDERQFLKALKYISSGKYETMEFDEFDG